MAKHAGISESDVKAAISAIRNRDRLDTSQLRLSQSPQLLGLRRKFGSQLQTAFAEADLDIEKINKILADHQKEARSVLEQEKSKSAKTFAALNRDQSEIANKKKTMEWLVQAPHYNHLNSIIDRLGNWCNACRTGCYADRAVQ
jgi:hypothetical protein